MVKIKFKYRRHEKWLESDDDQWIVHDGLKANKLKDGRKIYSRKNVNYFSELHNAVTFIRKSQIRKSDARTLSKLMKNLKEITELNKREMVTRYGKRKP